MNDLIKKGMKIRTKIIIMILIMVIIPVIIVTSFMLIKSFFYLKENTIKSYSNLLNQASINLDLVFNKYCSVLDNIIEKSDIRTVLLSGPFKNKKEELDITMQIEGEYGAQGKYTLRNTIEEQIDGYCILYQLDKKSLINNTPYKRFLSSPYIKPPNFDKLIQDPLYTRLINNASNSVSFGKLQKGVFSSKAIKEQVDIPVIIKAYNLKNKKSNNYNIIMFIGLSYGFVRKLYSEIERLNFGTLYVLDINNNILSRNHPSDDDYYSFNEQNGYMFDRDVDDKKDVYGMTFNQYKLLNVDDNILQTPKIQNIINDMTQKNFTDKITLLSHNSKKFVVMAKNVNKSKVKLLFFYPLKNVYSPLILLIFIISGITIIVILLIIIIGFVLSRIFTQPIKILESATHIISQGNYNNFIQINTGDEISELAKNFNSMVKEIKDYQDKLLSREKKKTEMELAKNIQTSLLPPIPKLHNFEVTGVMIPADDVGGDYFDVIPGISNDKLWVGIGDVSGHGLVSGLIMMMAQTAFNTLLLNNSDITTTELIRKVNRVLYQNIKNRLLEDHFMTLSFLAVDNDGNVSYSGAHEDILVYRKSEKKVERVKTTGIWLGLVKEINKEFNEKRFNLQKGDVLLLYTDGLIEAKNKQNKQYDMVRLTSRLQKWASLPIDEIKENLIDDVFNYMYKQDDDVTIILLRRK